MTKPTKGSPRFVPLATKAETDEFLMHIEYLRHQVFTTNRYFPNGTEEEWAWNVTEGYELARARGAEPEQFDPAEAGITPEHILERYPCLDIRNALTKADLSKPVLFVPSYQTVDGVKVATVQLIDGWHRLMRSVVESIETVESRPLLAYFLTEDEAQLIQITPIDEEKQSVPARLGTVVLRELSRRVKRLTGSAFPQR